ncbi:hypothetical protein BJX99DRAFT_258293 [Aspergillus californicus]
MTGDICTIAGSNSTESPCDRPQEILQPSDYRQSLETSALADINDCIRAEHTGQPPPTVAVEHSSVSEIWHETCGAALNEVSQEQWHIADRPDIVSNPPWDILLDQELGLPPHSDDQQQRRSVADPFMAGMDIDGFCHLSPGLLNYVDFPLTPTPLSSCRIDESSGTAKLPFSADQMQKLRPLWGTQRVAPAPRLCQSLWHTVLRHGADNIFSVPSAPSDSRSGHPTQCHQWNLDEYDRRRLVEFCEELVKGHGHQDDMAIFLARSPSTSQASVQSSPPELAVTELPNKEVLNASIDFFFQSFHAPFIHKATFHARNTPSSLLLPICLVGLAALYRERSNAYVVQYLTRLMAFCHRDLAYKSLGRSQPWELLSAIASALLVVYLALGFLEELDDGQAHLLCSQMLQLAEKHGLFAANDADDLNSQLQMKTAYRNSSWKAWARAESIKRMLNYLIWLDMAYTRMVGSTGSVDMSKLDLYLPCEAILFESPTASRFFQLEQRGVQPKMPRMQIHSFHMCGPSVLDSVSMQTLLSALLVQITTLRHKFPMGTPLIPEGPGTCSGSSGMLERESIIPGNIIPSLLSVPTDYAKIFHGKDVINALAWNNVCTALTADLTLLEAAFGREGLDAAHSAMGAVERWARTAAARRAAIHAAQMFEILSSARLSESNVARPDQMLYASALVLSMYLFASNPKQGDEDNAPPVFELLQDIDWAGIDREGITCPSEEEQESSNQFSAPMSPDSQNLHNSNGAARHFIRHGGTVSFAGEVQQDGGSALKKAMLNYVHLLEDIGKYRGSKYTRLLKTMCDFVIEEVK